MNKKNILRKVLITSMFVILPLVIAVPVYIVIKKNKNKFMLSIDINHINEKGINLITKFEGLRLTAYKDATGTLTIGYGHTGKDVKENMTITEEEAKSLLVKDVIWAENCIKSNVKVPITQNMFDALTSFIFNVGCGKFKKSSILKYINVKEYDLSATYFNKYVYSKGVKINGLVTRRKAETDLFLQK